MKVLVPLAVLIAAAALAEPVLSIAENLRASEEETVTPPPPPPKPLERLVRLTVRVNGSGEDAYLELPLPQSDEHQTIVSEKLITRGFHLEEELRDGNRLALLTYPKLSGPKRITYEFTVRTRSTKVEVPPAPVAIGEPSEEDWPWLRPTKQIQSSSPLIREKLITYAKPRLEAGERDAIRIAWDLAATGYVRKADGSRTVLKATRVGHASDLGLDRLFTTFLRTSGIPARPVIGVEVGKLKNRRHLARWVEVKSGGDWLPMSVPRDEYGRLRARYVKLSHGDRPFIVRRGIESLSYRWKLDRIPEHTEASAR